MNSEEVNKIYDAKYAEFLKHCLESTEGRFVDFGMPKGYSKKLQELTNDECGKECLETAFLWGFRAGRWLEESKNDTGFGI